ncbi:MAG TPA: hypothetical protein VF121_03905, partial [Thermoanaerobaculia bacterium]|nr:hypothetical protein [Thermoanaerobaculia bacterium]
MWQRSIGGQAPPPSPLEDLLSKLEARHAQFVDERESAAELCEELLAVAAAQREDAARDGGAYHTLALAELLVERSAAAGPGAIELARLAVAVADCLDRVRYPASLVHDLRARAWAQLAEARRQDGDRRGAGAALGVAEALSEHGSADPLEEGHLLERRAALLADEGDPEAAAHLLVLAAENYESVGDAPGAA